MIVFGALAMTVMGNKGLMGSKAPEPMTRPQVPQGPQQGSNGPQGPAADGSGISSSGSGSALRPPSMNGFGFNQQPVAPQMAPQLQQPKQIPDWARAALSGPLGPQEPQHFAKVVPPVAVPPTLPAQAPQQFVAAELKAAELKAAELKAAELKAAEAAVAATDAFPELNRELQMPVLPVPATEIKRLTLSSPKSSRRRREPQPELNLDE
jgi:hypothetical protein